jgi:hypothetical protein
MYNSSFSKQIPACNMVQLSRTTAAFVDGRTKGKPRITAIVQNETTNGNPESTTTVHNMRTNRKPETKAKVKTSTTKGRSREPPLGNRQMAKAETHAQIL